MPALVAEQNVYWPLASLHGLREVGHAGVHLTSIRARGLAFVQWSWPYGDVVLPH